MTPKAAKPRLSHLGLSSAETALLSKILKAATYSDPMPSLSESERHLATRLWVRIDSASTRNPVGPKGVKTPPDLT